VITIPYCPEQLKCQKLRVGGYTENILKWFNYPDAMPTPDVNLTAMGLNRLASSVCLWFVEASPTVEKAVSCYKANRLVASTLSFHSIRSLLAVWEFCAAGEESCEWGHGHVCVNFRCRGAQSASEQLQVCELSRPSFAFTTREFSMVGGYTDNPENHKSVKIGGGCLFGYGHFFGTMQ